MFVLIITDSFLLIYLAGTAYFSYRKMKMRSVLAAPETAEEKQARLQVPAELQNASPAQPPCLPDRIIFKIGDIIKNFGRRPWERVWRTIYHRDGL